MLDPNPDLVPKLMTRPNQNKIILGPQHWKQEREKLKTIRCMRTKLWRTVMWDGKKNIFPGRGGGSGISNDIDHCFLARGVKKNLCFTRTIRSEDLRAARFAVFFADRDRDPKQWSWKILLIFLWSKQSFTAFNIYRYSPWTGKGKAVPGETSPERDHRGGPADLTDWITLDLGSNIWLANKDK